MNKVVFAAIVAFVGSSAVAQPAPYPQPVQPVPYPQPAQATQPAAYPQPQPAQPAVYPQPTQPMPPVSDQPSAGAAPRLSNAHRGFTGEIGVGVGGLAVRSDNGSASSDTGIVGLNFAAGYWINPRLAVSLRSAGVSSNDSSGNTSLVGFFGPMLQYFATPEFAVGAGIGLGYSSTRSVQGSGNFSTYSDIGIHLRANYFIWQRGIHGISASAEYNRAPTSTGSAAGLGVAINYQLL
jgi:hypothetical protein